jgi:hypothetical protein
MTPHAPSAKAFCEIYLGQPHDFFSPLHEIQPVKMPSTKASAIHQMSFKNK